MRNNRKPCNLHLVSTKTCGTQCHLNKMPRQSRLNHNPRNQSQTRRKFKCSNRSTFGIGWHSKHNHPTKCRKHQVHKCSVNSLIKANMAGTWPSTTMTKQIFNYQTNLANFERPRAKIPTKSLSTTSTAHACNNQTNHPHQKKHSHQLGTFMN